MFKLVIVHKGKIQKNIPIRHDSMIIGRKPESDIHLEEKQVSSSHAELITNNNEVIIRDMDSTNGTSVNGTAVSEKKLQTGDQITIGSYKLIFVTEHGESDDPDATVIVSSNKSRPVATVPSSPASGGSNAKNIFIAVILILIAGGIAFLLL